MKKWERWKFNQIKSMKCYIFRLKNFKTLQKNLRTLEVQLLPVLSNSDHSSFPFIAMGNCVIHVLIKLTNFSTFLKFFSIIFSSWKIISFFIELSTMVSHQSSPHTTNIRCWLPFVLYFVNCNNYACLKNDNYV